MLKSNRQTFQWLYLGLGLSLMVFAEHQIASQALQRDAQVGETLVRLEQWLKPLKF